MDVREKLVELVDKARRYAANKCHSFMSCAECDHHGEYDGNCRNTYIAESLIAHGVTVQECAYWQYIEDDVDEDNNIQAYCSACGAGDKHAISMIGKVPYCWKCGRKMMPQPQKGE